MSALGLNQGQLAEELGVKQSYVSRVLSGLQEPSLKVFGLMCGVLGVGPGHLLEIPDIWTNGVWVGGSESRRKKLKKLAKYYKAGKEG